MRAPQGVSYVLGLARCCTLNTSSDHFPECGSLEAAPGSANCAGALTSDGHSYDRQGRRYARDESQIDDTPTAEVFGFVVRNRCSDTGPQLGYRGPMYIAGAGSSHPRLPFRFYVPYPLEYLGTMRWLRAILVPCTDCPRLNRAAF